MQTDLFNNLGMSFEFSESVKQKTINSNLPNQMVGYSPKQKAIELAVTNQDAKVEGWSDKALELLKQYSTTVADFITEDFRIYAESNGLEKPKEPRAYGAVVLRATKSNLIMWTGEYREMKNLKSHGCPKKVWCRS